MTAVFFAAFILGLSSSLHCIGMCGPLTLMIPVKKNKLLAKSVAFAFYHAGRILTYILLGVLFSLAGKVIYISGIQQYISITAGILILTLALIRILRFTPVKLNIPAKLNLRIRKLVFMIVNYPQHLLTPFFLGLVNGILPCGMIYIALMTVLSFSSTATGAGFMAVFGLGTVPALLLFYISADWLRPNLKIYLFRLSPVILAFTGFLLLLRGLNLAIPFLSPQLPQPLKEIISCH